MNDLLQEKAYPQPDDEVLVALLALQNVPGLGCVKQRRFVERQRSIRPNTRNVPISDELIQAVEGLMDPNMARQSFETARSELQRCRDRGIRPISLWSPDFPEALRECPDAPLVLFSTRSLPWNEKPILSVVGTRRMTHYGKGFCRDLMEVVRPYRPIVVSGFARGIDIEAQIHALDAGLETVAILAHGLGHIYPPEHRKYLGRMKAEGALATEFPYTEAPRSMHFVRRNRIIAGMAGATIVVESPEKSGSLSTAGLALDYNREVFALPGRYTDRFSQGCNRLIQSQAAQAIVRVDELPELLGWVGRYPKHEADPPKGAHHEAPETASSTHAASGSILEYLRSQGPQSANNLSVLLNEDVSSISRALLRLELKGKVVRIKGNLYECR